MRNSGVKDGEAFLTEFEAPLNSGSYSLRSCGPVGLVLVVATHHLVRELSKVAQFCGVLRTPLLYI